MPRRIYFVLEYISLPEHLKKKVREYESFHNDCLVPLQSEFRPSDYAKGMDAISEYWNDQKANNEYMPESAKQSLDRFIADYGLEFDVWMIEQAFNLKSCQSVLIDVSW